MRLQFFITEVEVRENFERRISEGRKPEENFWGRENNKQLLSKITKSDRNENQIRINQQLLRINIRKHLQARENASDKERFVLAFMSP